MQTENRMKTLAGLFKENNAQPVLLNGKRVHIDFRRVVTNGTIVDVEMLSKRLFGNPAFCIYINKGKFQINNREDSEFDKNEVCINWYKRAPKKFKLNVIARKNVEPEIVFYNGWWNFLGEFESSFDHDGVLIEDNDPSFVLRFNNGRNSKLTFDDLVVRLTFLDPE